MLYIVLALLGLVPAAWVTYRRKDVTLVATYFFAAAFVHTADWLASGVLGLYKYHPGLFSDPTPDDAAGIVLAEFIFVGTFAVLLVALVPSWWGALAGSAVVTMLEYVFHGVGALEYHGWRIWFTTAGFIVHFSLVRSCWLRADKQRPMCGWPLALQQLTIAIVFNGLAEVFLWATQVVYMPVTLLPSKGQNQALLRFLWHAFTGVPLAYWTLRAKGPVPWVRIIGAALISLALNHLFLMAGLRTFRDPWIPEGVVLVQSIGFILGCLVDHWIQVNTGPPRWEPPVLPRSHRR
ncbi:MAG TPA: hypothetical protein VD902_18905 [Symbiobacteriaceae bacterium]|nr:hypothetical protein [Symbiobacteriaceae bacterium]